MAGPFELVAYTSIQEMATRALYLHAARTCEREDPMLARPPRRISKDETLHMTDAVGLPPPLGLSSYLTLPRLPSAGTRPDASSK